MILKQMDSWHSVKVLKDRKESKKQQHTQPNLVRGIGPGETNKSYKERKCDLHTNIWDKTGMEGQHVNEVKVSKVC